MKTYISSEPVFYWSLLGMAFCVFLPFYGLPILSYFELMDPEFVGITPLFALPMLLVLFSAAVVSGLILFVRGTWEVKSRVLGWAAIVSFAFFLDGQLQGHSSVWIGPITLLVATLLPVIWLWRMPKDKTQSPHAQLLEQEKGDKGDC